jgi:hypothetical protein
MTETDFRTLVDRLRARASWGSADTHIDALCHVIFDGEQPMATGSPVNSIALV